MITIDSGQQQIASRDNALIVTLVKLDTFTDHIASTIDETFYFATLPIQYQWDGLSTNQFRGVLKGASPVSRGFPHLPDASELTTRDAMQIDLDASDQGGEFPWNRLTGKNLIGAQIEVASLLLDLSNPRPDNWQDQSSLGAVHTVRFRGEVTDVPEYDDEGNELSLTCESMDPVLDWPEALNVAEVSQKDLGSLYPVPVGAANRVPLVQRQVGWVTTINADITDTTTGTVAVTDATGFPASPAIFAVMIGKERITASRVDDVSISIINRATTSGTVATTAVAHNFGSVMVEEIDVARFVYSGVPAMGITNLYAMSPQTNELVRIPWGNFGIATQDESLDSGHKLGVFTFTKQLWAQVVRLLNRDADVTSDPVFVNSTSIRSEVPARITTAAVSGSTGNESSSSILGSVGTVAHSSTLHNAVFYYWLNGDLASTTDSVVRARIHAEYTISSDSIAATRFRIAASSNFLKVGGSLSSLLQHQYTLVAGAPTAVRSIITPWMDCPSGTTVADMVNGVSFSNSQPAIQMFIEIGGVSSQVDADRVNISVELELAGGGITQTKGTAITGAQEYGFNLDLFADVLGAVTLGTVTSKSEFDDSTGWAGTDAVIGDVGASGDGLKIDGAGTAVLRTATLTGISPALDFQGARFKFEYLVSAASLDLFHDAKNAFKITLLSSLGNFVRWGYPKSVLHGDSLWHEFSLEIHGSVTQIDDSLGTLVDANIVQIKIEWESKTILGTGSLWIRNLRSEASNYNTHPIDVAQWLIEESAGQSGAADATTFATAKTNLPGVVMGGDLRNAGSSFGDVLARIGKECRTNFVPSEVSGGTAYKAFNALSTYAFPSSAKTISEFKKLKTKTKPIDEQVNEFVGVYEFRNELGAETVDGFKSLIQANATTNDISSDVPTIDITNAQARVGVRPSDPEGFLFLNDSASMIEVFAYIVKETLRGDARRYSLLVSQSIGYVLEPGDIVDFTPRWASAAIKCRLIQHVFTFDDPLIGLNLEEVL